MQNAATVYLIGAGSLGRRHLEGLYKAATPFPITVIDPSPTALQEAKKVSAPEEHPTDFSETIPEREDVDLAIIATTSRHRADAVRELLKETKNVRCLILEKILFEKKEDYGNIGKLLDERGVKACVNTPLRLMPFHRTLRERLSGAPFKATIRTGRRYGLATNLMHYADLCSFIAGELPQAVDVSKLSPTLTLSKREGFFELEGSLSFSFPVGSTALVERTADDNRAFLFENKSGAILVDEKAGSATLPSGEKVDAPLLYQSDMTGPLTEEILESGTCGLPSYEDSARLHLILLEPIREFLSQTQPLDIYPFT